MEGVMSEFEGKVVVVTGASRGMGLQTAKEFAALGARVLMVASDTIRLAAAADSVEKNRENVFYAACDLRDKTQVEALFASVEQDLGRVDVLVNNAGAYSEKAPWDGVSDEQWQGAYALNTLAPYHCSVAAAHIMQRAGIKGCIVNVGSSTALRYKTGRTHYTVSKAGEHALSQVLALDLARYGIRVNLVSPGPTATETVQARMDDPTRRPAEEARMKKIPLGRYADTRDIANAVVFLASEKAAFITGAVLPVDGGYTIGEPPAAE